MTPDQALISQTHAAWFQGGAALAQFIAAFILIIVTCRYVKLTKDILNAPFKTYLRPSIPDRRDTDGYFVVSVTNAGQSIAKNVRLNLMQKNRVIGVAKLKRIFDTTYDNALHYAPSIENDPDQPKEFIFFLRAPSTCTFRIRWKTLLNDMQESTWLYENGIFTDIS